MKKGFDKKQIKKELEMIWFKMGCFTISGESMEELIKREKYSKKD